MHEQKSKIYEYLSVRGEVILTYQDGKKRGALVQKKNDVFYVIDWLSGEDDEILLFSKKTNNDNFWKRKFSAKAFDTWISHISGETPCYWHTKHELINIS